MRLLSAQQAKSSVQMETNAEILRKAELKAMVQQEAKEYEELRARISKDKDEINKEFSEFVDNFIEQKRTLENEIKRLQEIKKQLEKSK